MRGRHLSILVIGALAVALGSSGQAPLARTGAAAPAGSKAFIERAAHAGLEEENEPNLRPPRTEVPTDDFYFTGTANDEANKYLFAPTATFDPAAPSSTTPIVQQSSPLGFETPGDPLTAYWIGPYSGTLQYPIEFNWYWSSPNAEGTVLGIDADVWVYADADVAAGTGTLVGHETVTFTNVTAEPTLEVSTIAVPAPVDVSSNLLIQVAPYFVDTGPGLSAVYGSTSTPSVMRIATEQPPPPPPPPPSEFDTTPVAFGPSTIVSANLLGAEPQTTIERPLAGTPDGVLDPNRVFVDWPFSSRSQTGTLHRSLDGGATFRPLIDLTCAPRNRPNCNTSGGGDTEEEVNPFTGTLFFGDQEAVAGEALASSIDHGDTFPDARQWAVTSPTSGVDRQWLTASPPGAAVSPLGKPIEAFYTYHVPAAGQYVIGVDSDGTPIFQPVPQIALVGQSGQPRVDMTGSPAHGWIYQPYIATTGGTAIAVAPAANWADPAAWHTAIVSDKSATTFPWAAIDAHGNAYVSFDDEGVMYYAFSRIDDPANNPAVGGIPGSVWSAPVRVSLPSVGSAVFSQVIAGDDGRIALAYDGSTDFVGVPDDAPATAQWQTYAAIIHNATAADGEPIHIATGLVSHRVIHEGNICTGGTGCVDPLDRSLLDMIDLGIHADGSLGVVFSDNNNAFGRPDANPEGPKESPFVKFANQVQGPSLLAAPATINRAFGPVTGTPDPAGDATWPNTAAATNLPSLDSLGASVRLVGSDIVARLPLAATSVTQMQDDLAAYNAVFATTPPAERLQYVISFSDATDVFHVSMEQLADGTRRFFGGVIDSDDGLIGNGTDLLAMSYHTDEDVVVTGTVDAGGITFTVPASAFGLVDGAELFSAYGFTMAGPTEELEVAAQNMMRTIDATAPFDTLLHSPSADLSITLAGEPASVPSGGTLTYTAVVTNNGPDAAQSIGAAVGLDHGVDFVSATSTAGSCRSAADGVYVICTVSSLPAGESFTITVVVQPNLPAGSVVSARSRVRAKSPLDPDPLNNRSGQVFTTIS